MKESHSGDPEEFPEWLLLLFSISESLLCVPLAYALL